MSESRFGEPFTKTANGAEIFGAMLYDVRQSDGDIVVPDLLHGLAKRIVACANACASMDDPTAEIAAKDARIAELERRAEIDWDRNSALTDAVKRVRNEAFMSHAAKDARIAELEAENARLRKALEDIIKHDDFVRCKMPIGAIGRIARAALEPKS